MTSSEARSCSPPNAWRGRAPCLRRTQGSPLFNHEAEPQVTAVFVRLSIDLARYHFGLKLDEPHEPAQIAQTALFWPVRAAVCIQGDGVQAVFVEGDLCSQGCGGSRKG